MICIPSPTTGIDKDDREHPGTARGVLEQQLLAQILGQAGRAVEDLQVRLFGRRLSIRGSARSYYDWQRIQVICRDFAISTLDLEIDCAMTVSYVSDGT